MRITLLAGGIGAARFIRGLKHHLAATPPSSTTGSAPDATPAQPSASPGQQAQTAPRHEVTVIGNTADDIQLYGLQVCPDLDTVMYTLGGGIHEQQGWGRTDETYTVKEELAAYGVEPQWFGLGDRDIATHLVRTQMLDAGYPLSQITQALCERWQPGVHLVPMTDDRVETHVVIEDPDTGGSKAVHFQEWWVRLHAKPAAQRILLVGIEQARPAPGVIEAINNADLILLPPSNPVVSIGPILAVPSVREAIRDASAPVVGLSPIIGGAPVRGMADACLSAVGVETTAAAVAGLYADFLGGWLVDASDAATVPTVEALGIRCHATPLYMTDLDATAAMAAEALRLAEEVR